MVYCNISAILVAIIKLKYLKKNKNNYLLEIQMHKTTMCIFLFSSVNSYNYPVKMHITNPQYAIYASSSIGPKFGEGHDLYI
jgi:hypothetical protein